MAFDPKALVGKAAQALRGLAARLPFAKKAAPGGGGKIEPFSSILDESGGADLALEPNAAIKPAKAKAKFDFRAFLASFFKNPLALAGTAGVLLVLLLIAVSAFVAGAPPKAAVGGTPPTAEGIALVERFILPPDGTMRAEVELERPLKRVYTLEDATRARSDPALVDISALSARNDAAADALFGTVP
ncbi:MAG: hypothetical protein JNG85_07535 [Spirochaetaceae bacterium]|nr:hypothetical protein [Spirochaetaceae bacterium]